MEELEKLIDNDTLTIDLVNNEEYVQEKIEELKYFHNNCEKYSKKLKNVNIIVANERIPYDIFVIADKIYQNYNSAFNINFLVKHYNNYNRNISQVTKLWDLETVLKANSFIDNICSTIKKNKLTPAEALAYIHLRVSKITTYSASKNREWFSNDQYLTGAFMKNPEFVCAGFASLEKQIIDELNMSGLKCDMVAVDYIKKGCTEYESHARLLINLDDEKYSIKGHFFSDPTWDNVEKDKEPIYTNLFLPLDCHNYNKSKFNYDETASIFVPVGKYGYKMQDFSLDFIFNNEKPNYLKQEKQEEIVFNTMAKTSNKSFNELYGLLSKMAVGTYENQINKQYDFFDSASLKISKLTAKDIYSNAKNKLNEQEKYC